ncbi:MAG: hypothetical protein VYD21_04105 [Candidatus Thermoplasmatota archaeon]|nr:hypothetical protein [Candidatus Thermoplasmatota archaeon]
MDNQTEALNSLFQPPIPQNTIFRVIDLYACFLIPVDLVDYAN